MVIEEISTEQLHDRIKQGTIKPVDIRPTAAYNGWCLNDEPRGGHIKGAVMFPRQWAEREEFRGLFKDKGLSPDDQLCVYGYDQENTRYMADKLTAAGFRNTVMYHGFAEWSGNDDLPMDRLKRYHKLVYPEWLHGVLNNKDVPHPPQGDVVLCHATYGFREDYDQGHIPGAIHLDTLSLESPEDWNRRSPEELADALTKAGIQHDSTVVLYGRFAEPDKSDEYPGKRAGHLASIRCAAILMYAGVKDVRVLNGGLLSWESAGYETTTDETKPKPVDSFGADIPGNPDVMIDTPKAKELLAADDGELVSVRSWEEFIGNESGYNYFDRAGRIPGARFGNSGSDAYHMENYRNLDHTLREYHVIEATWAQSGITPDKHVAFYCGTGWRASEAFLHAYLMGWPRASVYDGGWFEWSNNPENPVETGEPE